MADKRMIAKDWGSLKKGIWAEYLYMPCKSDPFVNMSFKPSAGDSIKASHIWRLPLV